MKNIDVIRKFVDGDKEACTNDLYIDVITGGTALIFVYEDSEILIAEQSDDGERYNINRTTYNDDVTKIQDMLLYVLDSRHQFEHRVNCYDVPANAERLGELPIYELEEDIEFIEPPRTLP